MVALFPLANVLSGYINIVDDSHHYALSFDTFCQLLLLGVFSIQFNSSTGKIQNSSFYF